MRMRQGRAGEAVIEAVVRALGFSTIGFVLLIFLFLLREGIPAFFEVSPAKLFSGQWYPTFGLFGMLPLVLGSMLVTLGAVAIAVPLGWPPPCSSGKWLRDGRGSFSSP